MAAWLTGSDWITGARLNSPVPTTSVLKSTRRRSGVTTEIVRPVVVCPGSSRPPLGRLADRSISQRPSSVRVCASAGIPG